MRIGLAQMNIKWENKRFNKRTCCKFFIEAKLNKVDFVIFPEMTLTGFTMNVKEMCDENEAMEWFKERAIEFSMYIGFGYIKLEDNGKGRNCFSIISPRGKVLCDYEKIHPFSYGKESGFYEGGGRIVLSNILEFNVSSFICYDLRFPEIFQLASKKAELITICANWPEERKEHWEILLKARAIENQCYIAAVNTVKRVDGIRYSGDSMIVDPYGNIIITEANKEKLLISEIDINKVKQLRQEFNLKQDRREEFYYECYKVYRKNK